MNVRWAEKEHRTAELYADGLTYAEIGAELTIGVETVRTYLKRFRARNGLETRRDVIAHFRDIAGHELASSSTTDFKEL